MFYRRKLLLSLVESSNRPLSKLDLQKYLFLLCTHQKKPAYEFVPHRFGCYSFQVDADKRTLTKYGYVLDTDKWILDGKHRFTHLLISEDLQALHSVLEGYGHLSGHDLLKRVYAEYPYYAQNSELKSDVLTREMSEAVERARPIPKPARFFTIGYEGISLEAYLRKLMDQKVNLLCDVRKNPLSMKFGFSKNQLRSALSAVGIDYIHMPQLGIESSKRKDLASQNDYDQLFAEYRKTVLRKESDSLKQLTDFVRTHQRIAITCFEADANSCHRSSIAARLMDSDGFGYRVYHL